MNPAGVRKEMAATRNRQRRDRVMGLWLLLNRNRDEHMAGRRRQQVHELLLQQAR